MSDLLPAKIDRIFTVGPSGEVAVVKPKEKTFSNGQRHAAWRVGLQAVNKFMADHGFEGNIGYSSTHMGWQKGRFSVNVSLREPDNVAYITSRVGYDPSQPRPKLGRDAMGTQMYGVTAEVTTLRQVVDDAKYVLMVDVSESTTGTRPPVYIPLPMEGDHPARFVYRSVLSTIAMLCSTVPGMEEAFQIERVRAAQNLPINDDS